MKNCLNCDEYMCVYSHTDNVSKYCGNDSTPEEGSTERKNEMHEFQTGAVRQTGGKGRMDLLPWCALIRISKHMENTISPDPETGIPHYPERNWENGLPMHTMIDSAFRHLAKYVDGQNDEDHLCAAATNLLMALWTDMKRPEMQDIPSRIGGAIENTSPRPEKGSSLAQKPSDGLTPTYEPETQEKATEKLNHVCECFDIIDGEEKSARCMGTKDREYCDCNGDKSRCNFYPKYRIEGRKLKYGEGCFG